MSSRPPSSPTAPRSTSTPFLRRFRVKQYPKDRQHCAVETIRQRPQRSQLPHLACTISDELRSTTTAVQHSSCLILKTCWPGLHSLPVRPSNGWQRPPSRRGSQQGPGLTFDDPQFQTLADALCTTSLAVTGITDESLRRLDGELARRSDYSMNQTGSDLAPLRLNKTHHPSPGPRAPLPPHHRRPHVQDLLSYPSPRRRLLRPLLTARRAARSTIDTKHFFRTINIHITQPMRQSTRLRTESRPETSDNSESS